MDVQGPKRPPTSLREFRREYAMIVLSILTALGFERGVVYLQDRANAAASRARIEQEIGDDLADLRRALATNNASVTAGQAALNGLLDVLKAPTPDTAAEKRLIGDELQKHLGLALPTWERDAWDAAVADQSVSHLDPRDLRRYAKLYTDARDAADATHILLGGAIFDRVADLLIDVKLDDSHGRDAAKVIARFVSAAQQITAMQQDLLTDGEGGEKAKIK
jgi:hypothetical protein